MKKTLPLIASLLVVGGLTSAQAQLFNFEGLPSNVVLDNGGVSQDIGNIIPGLNFGPGVRAIHSISGYPSHSGVLELLQSSSTHSDIFFSTSIHGVNLVSFWYTTAAGFVATAYDQNNNIVGNFIGGPNTDTLHGNDNLAVLNSFTTPIDHVSIVDNFTAFGGFLTIDDLLLSGPSVPDVASTLGLLALASGGLFVARRRFAV